ncbi:MAG: ferredoxin family protein [Anaerolineae bacterium]|jgi:ferredoxin--NADP+ reductase
MTYVITGNCVRDGSCVEVCPVECIVSAPDAVAVAADPDNPTEDEYAKALLAAGADKWTVAYWIDPEICIDCGACAPECPTEAIYPDDEVPAEFEEWTAMNAEYYTDGPGYG